MTSGLCYVLHFYDVIAELMSRFSGSKFVWILACNTRL